MAIDAYSLCPAGTGKKIKFCCPDLISDLDKIERMIEGEQYVACLHHIDQLEKKDQYRACLMAAKSELLRITDQLDAARSYVAEFLQRFPENPTAWAESALLAMMDEGGRPLWANCTGHRPFPRQNPKPRLRGHRRDPRRTGRGRPLYRRPHPAAVAPRLEPGRPPRL